MERIQIKSRWTQQVLFEVDAEDLKVAVDKAKLVGASLVEATP